MGTPMGGFFDRANMVFKIVIPAPPAAAQGVTAKAPIPSTRSVPIGEDIYIKRVVRLLPFLQRHLLSKKESFLLLLLRPRLLLLPHLLLSLPVTPSRLYLKPRRMAFL